MHLLIVGLLTAGVGYPLLHEMGHVLAALCVGAAVKEVYLLPTASVLCRMPSAPVGIVAVGLGGPLFPCVAATLLPHRRFWGWFVRYILLTVCLMALVTAAAATVCFQVGYPLPQEDVTQILQHVPQALPLLYGVTVAALTAMAVLWVRARPISRCTQFLCR